MGRALPLELSCGLTAGFQRVRDAGLPVCLHPSLTAVRKASRVRARTAPKTLAALRARARIAGKTRPKPVRTRSFGDLELPLAPRRGRGKHFRVSTIFNSRGVGGVNKCQHRARSRRPRPQHSTTGGSLLRPRPRPSGSPGTPAGNSALPARTRRPRQCAARAGRRRSAHPWVRRFLWHRRASGTASCRSQPATGIPAPPVSWRNTGAPAGRA